MLPAISAANALTREVRHTRTLRHDERIGAENYSGKVPANRCGLTV